MDPVLNPYSPGAGSRPPALVGRDEQIDHMNVALQRLLLGSSARSQLLTGLRGVGKTVMLVEFQELADAHGYFHAHIEVTEDGVLAPDLAAALRRVLLSMDAKRRAGDTLRRAFGVLKAFSLRIPNGPELSIDVDAVFGPADSGNLGADLAGLFVELGRAARDHQTGILLTVDELHYVDRATLESLVIGLHRAAQLALPVVVAGAGLPTLAATTGQAKAYAERLFTFPQIGSLTNAQAIEALQQPAEDEGIVWSDDALALILHVAQCYPYFIQQSGRQAWDVADGREIEAVVQTRVCSVGVSAAGKRSSVDVPAAAAPVEYGTLIEQLGVLRPTSPERRHMVEAAIRVWRRPGFDTFASVSNLPFDPFDHQLRAASVVLQRMSGRAILADEVGLGKTIEAGIVLSELRLRGLARRVLVLAPTGLVAQWGEELERKFALPTVVASRQGWENTLTPSAGIEDPVVLASLATARRQPLCDLLTKVEWDLVVVDEAHRVRNPRTASSKLVRALRARFMLLLTATPVENRIDDLYHLVSLVRPGHLGTVGDFRRRHGAPPDREPTTAPAGSGAATPRVAALGDLRRSMRDVMVRHRRSEVSLMLPRRLAETLPVQPSRAEADLYGQIAERVRSEGRQTGAGRSMALRTVLRLAGSSMKAAAPTLDRMGWSDQAEAARAVSVCAKTTALETLLQRYAASGEKVIVFTSFRETLAQLLAAAQALDVPVAEYHGGLDRKAKDAAISSFENDVNVLVSTESAGEGRNLQFCHAMINFDLPWNPMQIEQRLGRIHRIGQTHDVVLTNLVSRGTIEDHILEVLHTKLNLFELVVGELDMVLGRVGEEFMFEDAVFDAHVSSVNDAEMRDRLENIGSTLVQARAEYAESRVWTDDLVAEMDGGPTAPSDSASSK